MSKDIRTEDKDANRQTKSPTGPCSAYFFLPTELNMRD